MRTMTVTHFKTHALKVLSEVYQTRESVVITKRGKPLARVVPCTEEAPEPGSLAETIVYEGDVISPVAEEDWESCR